MGNITNPNVQEVHIMTHDEIERYRNMPDRSLNWEIILELCDKGHEIARVTMKTQITKNEAFVAAAEFILENNGYWYEIGPVIDTEENVMYVAFHKESDTLNVSMK